VSLYTYMLTFDCPRCLFSNTYLPPSKSDGYARCTRCNIALEWVKNSDGTIDIHNHFVPDWCTESPKTNRILAPEVGYKMPKEALKIYAFLKLPGASEALRRRQIRDGMLKRKND